MKNPGIMVWFSALRVRIVTPTQPSTPDGCFSCSRPWWVPINTPGLPSAAPLQLPELKAELPLPPSPNMQTITEASCPAPRGQPGLGGDRALQPRCQKSSSGHTGEAEVAAYTSLWFLPTFPGSWMWLLLPPALLLTEGAANCALL